MVVRDNSLWVAACTGLKPKLRMSTATGEIRCLMILDKEEIAKKDMDTKSSNE